MNSQCDDLNAQLIPPPHLLLLPIGAGDRFPEIRKNYMSLVVPRNGTGLSLGSIKLSTPNLNSEDKRNMKNIEKHSRFARSYGRHCRHFLHFLLMLVTLVLSLRCCENM